MKVGGQSRKARANGATPSGVELSAAHKRALKQMDEMSAREGFDLLVKTGIINRTAG